MQDCPIEIDNISKTLIDIEKDYKTKWNNIASSILYNSIKHFMFATSKRIERFLKLNLHIFNTFISTVSYLLYIHIFHIEILLKKVVFNFQKLLNLKEILKEMQLQPRINFSQINDL